MGRSTAYLSGDDKADIPDDKQGHDNSEPLGLFSNLKKAKEEEPDERIVSINDINDSYEMVEA